MKYSKYNIVIVGSGLAGLFLANKLACDNAKNNDFKDGILLITKETLFSGSTALAQGGIVSVIPEINTKDSIESHVTDTIKAGCGLNDINAVKFVSTNSSLAAQDLIGFGVEFDKNILNGKNSLNFTLEAAHSCPRILHAKGDSTGRVIEETLCDRLKTFKNVQIYENTMAVELLVDNENSCNGLVAYNWQNNTYEAIYTNNVVLATGGIGQIYKTTTNPKVSTGDGIALASLAGAKLMNMEFVQFHPTSLYCETKETMPLVSESVRGEGAKLVDINGDYFAKNYHYKGELAPRDVVARAIDEQIKLTKADFVNLDISQIGIEKFKQRFPTITQLCQENNVDLSLGLIPVVPCEHYFMGGIKTDLDSKTNIKNLYAIGECAATGLHGANRLASNSLLECAVFAGNLAQNIAKNNIEPPKKFDEKIKQTLNKYDNIDNEFEENKDDIIKKMFLKLKQLMTDNVGILRDDKSLITAIDSINQLSNKLDTLKAANSRLKFELNNALIVANEISLAALNRNESIGAHYRVDFEKEKIEKSFFVKNEIDNRKVNNKTGMVK